MVGFLKEISLYRARHSDKSHKVSQFHWGGFTPQQVQKINYLAKRDEEMRARNKQRDALAKIGTSGENPKNLARDIFRHLPKNRLPLPRYIRVPVRHKLLGRGRPLFPFTLPHALFSAIYHNYPDAWRKVIAPPGEIEKFWDQVKGGTWALYITCGMCYSELILS